MMTNPEPRKAAMEEVRIVVVDDNADAAEMLASLLTVSKTRSSKRRSCASTTTCSNR
jgi:CheY-like chemotaxis protein